MPAFLTKNRRMFWRIIRRLLFAHRGRLFVILLALGTGAAVTAALLNLQVDAKRRLTTEFRVLGANVIIAPRGTSDSRDSPKVLSESLFGQLPAENEGIPASKAEFLYGIVDIAPSLTNPPKLSSQGSRLPSDPTMWRTVLRKSFPRPLSRARI